MRKTNIEPILPKNIFSPHLTLFEVSVVEVARQLTILSFQLFHRINVGDIVSKEWREQQKISPHVSALLERTSLLTRWVTSTILQGISIEERASHIVYFANLVEELVKINNFNDAFAIFNGIYSTHVLRLKETLAKVPEQQRIVTSQKNKNVENILTKSMCRLWKDMQ